MPFQKGHGGYNLRQKPKRGGPSNNKNSSNEKNVAIKSNGGGGQKHGVGLLNQSACGNDLQDTISQDGSSVDQQLFESHFVNNQKNQRQKALQQHKHHNGGSIHGDGCFSSDGDSSPQHQQQLVALETNFSDVDENITTLSTSDEQHEYKYLQEREALTDGAAVLSSLSRGSSSGYENLSTATRTSSSNSSGCKRDSGEAGMVNHVHARADRGGVYYSNKRLNGESQSINNAMLAMRKSNLEQHLQLRGGDDCMDHEQPSDVQSLTASLTGMSTVMQYATGEEQCHGHNYYSAIPPPRAPITSKPLDYFKPGSIISGGGNKQTASSAISSVKENNVFIGKPSVSVAAKRAAAAPSTVTSNKGRSGSGGIKGRGDDQDGSNGDGGGGMSILESTLQIIKQKNLMPKPHGSTTDVKMVTVVDDANKEVGFIIANAFGGREEIKELKTCPKRLMYKEHVEKVLNKHVSDTRNRNAPYMKTGNGQPVWLFSNLGVTTDEYERDQGDVERYFEVKEHWRHFFSCGRRDPDNGNRPFTLEETTHRLAPNEMEAFVFLSASIYSKDDYPQA